MKRALRIIALVTACVILCISLVSCDIVEEMRASRGNWNEDGSISFNGATYLALPECKYLAPMITNVTDYILVAEPDVPLLLSEQLGTSFLMSDDEVFLDSEGDLPFLFCREDKYSDMVERIEAGVDLTTFCYSYYEYNEDFDLVCHYYTLSKMEAAAVMATITNPVELPAGSSIYYDGTVDLFRCSDDLLFRERAFALWLVGEEYYIVVENAATFETEYYLAPEKHKATFSRMLAQYTESLR